MWKTRSRYQKTAPGKPPASGGQIPGLFSEKERLSEVTLLLPWRDGKAGFAGLSLNNGTRRRD